MKKLLALMAVLGLMSVVAFAQDEKAEGKHESAEHATTTTETHKTETKATHHKKAKQAKGHAEKTETKSDAASEHKAE